MSYLSILCADLYQYLQRFVYYRYVPPHFSLQGEQLLTVLDGPIDHISCLFGVLIVRADNFRYIFDIDHPLLRTKTPVRLGNHECEAIIGNNLYSAHIQSNNQVRVHNFQGETIFSYTCTFVNTAAFYGHLLLIAKSNCLLSIDVLNAGEIVKRFQFSDIAHTHRLCVSRGDPVLWRGDRVVVLMHDGTLHKLLDARIILDLDTDDDGNILILCATSIEVFNNDRAHLFSYNLQGFYLQRIRIVDHRLLCVRFDRQLWLFNII
jgi:hypothetical protein